MSRNKNKIIRSVTVSQSLGFCREVMIKMRAMGFGGIKKLYLVVKTLNGVVLS